MILLDSEGMARDLQQPQHPPTVAMVAWAIIRKIAAQIPSPRAEFSG
jgi:hypothetical protein